MCIIIKEMSLFWTIGLIIGLQVLWSGVITAGNVTAAPGVETTTSNEISAFIISIKITNRIYNESLEDHQSQNYKTLRQDVENVFFEIYSLTPSAHYQDIAEMTFSNGSVIASSTVIFGTKQKSGQTVKNIFVTNYQHHPSQNLDLNINYTADQEPIPVPLYLLQEIPDSVPSMTASITRPNSHIIPELSDHIQSGSSTTSTTSASTISGPDKSLDNNNAITATPKIYSTTKASDFTHSASRTTSNIISNTITTEHPSAITSTMSASSSSTMTEHPSNNISTIQASHPVKTTVHINSNISTMSASSSPTTTVHPSSNISTMSASSSLTMTVHPSSNISTMSASSSSTTTIHPSSNISTMSASSPSTTNSHHPSNNISIMSASSSSTTTVHHPSSKISTMSASNPSTTTVHPSSNISDMSASSSSVIPGKTITQKPSGPEGTDTVVTEQGVPGWGIAILVLAAVILFFMLVLLILLLLFWCCWWRQRGFMSVSDPDPTGYYNPDIPMYSTHSTYDSHNGKSLIGP